MVLLLWLNWIWNDPREMLLQWDGAHILDWVISGCFKPDRTPLLWVHVVLTPLLWVHVVLTPLRTWTRAFGFSYACCRYVKQGQTYITDAMLLVGILNELAIIRGTGKNLIAFQSPLKECFVWLTVLQGCVQCFTWSLFSSFQNNMQLQLFLHIG